MGRLVAHALPGLPEIEAGCDLAALLLTAARRAELTLTAGTVVTLSHKAVAKAEGATVTLANVTPSPRAIELTRTLGRADARVVQVVLDQSERIVRAQRGVLICRTRHGFVCANAGIDASNAAHPDELTLLPLDPDASARRLRARLGELCGGARPAVLIADSFGRAWRHGQCDVAIGCAGLQPLDDWRGRTDSGGRELHATLIAIADAAAAAADLVRAKDSREPAVLIEGLERHVISDDGPGAAALIRPADEDMFL